MTIRSPICTFEGHVDSGKTSIQDWIRGSSVFSGEAGAITQAIGASIVPLEVIKKVCGSLLDVLNMKINIPGLLFIDTPGHAAFSSLRKRGGNLADIAVVVINVNEGIMPQTKEAIEILKSYKTPFLVALNKIDLITGYQEKKKYVLENLKEQSPQYVQQIETKMYEVVGQLHELGFDSERFDRVSDYTKQIALVPTSAKTGAGIPELLMVMTGLAQKYLQECLHCDVSGKAKGIILEVKEEKGMGKTLDVILYDGSIKVNDSIVIGSLGEPIVTKVKSLFEPDPLKEMRDPKTKFKTVKNVSAAMGVKICAPDIKEAVSGMPIRGCDEDNIEQVKEEVQKEIEEVVIHTDKKGIIVKADTLGSLEAVDILLKEKVIKIRKASIGNISKKDLSEAESMYGEDPLQAVVLGFNVKVSADAKDVSNKAKAKVITNQVIYKLVEDLEKWQEELKKKQQRKEFEKIQKPFKARIMPGYVFRQSNPAVCGVEVIQGALKTNSLFMKKDGHNISKIKSLQVDKESVEEVKKGKSAAASIDGVTIGRQIFEDDIIYSDISEIEFRKLKELKKYLSEDEKEILKEIAEIKRKENPVWGI